MLFNDKKGRFNVFKRLKDKALKGKPEKAKSPEGLEYLLSKFDDFYDQHIHRYAKYSTHSMEYDNYKLYWKANNMLELSKYSLNDVERFCIEMPEFLMEKENNYQNGILISAFLAGTLNYKLTKETKVVLELGGIDNLHYLGMYQLDGTMKIRGKCNVGLGYKKTGGDLLFDGEAGAFVGYQMHGGKIKVKGSLLNIDQMCKGGEIYLNDKKLMPKEL